MSIDGIVISCLLTVLAALLGVIYRSAITRLTRLEANFYNFTRATFMLLGKLHPTDAALIAEATTQFYVDSLKRPNGKAASA